MIDYSIRTDAIGRPLRRTIDVLVTSGHERRPTLAEKLWLLGEAEIAGAGVVEWNYSHKGLGGYRMVLRRCECSGVAHDDDVCRVCRLFATLLIGEPGDLQQRYELAERTLDRLAEVVAELKKQVGTEATP